MRSSVMKALAMTSLVALAACSRVEPGHVGVKVERYGSGAGVQQQSLGVGTYWTGWGTDIYEYPVYTQNYVWLNSEEKKEAFSFQDKNGLVVSADVGLAYHADPVKAPTLFTTYRTDVDGLISGPLRNTVRDALVAVASTMTVEDIYGPKKADLLAHALERVRKVFEAKGLHVDSLYWGGPVRIPENILEQINARASNEQQAIAAQANVATVEAKGRARVAQAEANGRAQVVAAEAAAQATRIEAAALASNPTILQQRAIEKWDGHLPTTMGAGAVPFVKVN